MSDSLIHDVMYTYFWTAQWCGEVMADESPLILPGDTVVKAEPTIAVFRDLQPNGVPLNWIWLFSDTEQMKKVWGVGLNPTFQKFGTFQDLVERTIQPYVGSTRKTNVCAFDPALFVHMPNLREEVDEVWIGFDANRLALDCNPRTSTLAILSLDEYLDRLKRRIV